MLALYRKIIREKVCRLNIRKAFLLDCVRFKTTFDSACSFQVKSRGIKKCCGIKKSRESSFPLDMWVNFSLSLSLFSYTQAMDFSYFTREVHHLSRWNGISSNICVAYFAPGESERKRGKQRCSYREHVIFACRVYFLLFLLIDYSLADAFHRLRYSRNTRVSIAITFFLLSIYIFFSCKAMTLAPLGELVEARIFWVGICYGIYLIDRNWWLVDQRRQLIMRKLRWWFFGLSLSLWYFHILSYFGIYIRISYFLCHSWVYATSLR